MTTDIILQALQEEPSSLQEPTNIMHIQLNDWIDENVPVKILGVKVVALYNTGTNMSCMQRCVYTY